MSYLVIQGRELKDGEAQTLATLAGAARIETPGAEVLRLEDPQTPDRAEDYCEGAQLDCAFVPVPRRLADIGLVAMDMDSTLITIECIDEIADLQGLKPQVAAITASAMRGEIEYTESLRRRVALLQGLSESALQRVYDEHVKFSPGAERLIERLRSLGIRTLLVSGGFTFFTSRLKTRLGIDDMLSNTLEIKNGTLTGKVLGRIVDAQGKATRVRELREELKLRRDQVIAIGDGANDLAMMAEAGFSIAWRAKPVVREKATWHFDYSGLDGLLNLYD